MFETIKTGNNAGMVVRLTIGKGSPSFMDAPMTHHKLGLSYTATGYGEKIPMPYKVRTIDQKWRRVYCRIFSNVGTLYVMHGKEKTIVDIV